jgi:hypothetical protein
VFKEVTLMSDRPHIDRTGTIRFSPASRFAHDPRDLMLPRAMLLLGALIALLIWRVVLLS